MINERLSWRKAFEKIGPETLRIRLEHRRAEFPVEYAREAEAWLLEKDAENAAIELRRFQTIRLWTVVAGVAGSVAAIAGLISAFPVIRKWFR
jgi:hypothetical protein